jgi:hypothetical protein
MLLWFNDCPTYIAGNDESKRACEEFADKLITCEKLDKSEFPAIEYQIHKHSRTCKKRTPKGIVCRFHVPWYPMDKTTIFEPFTEYEYENIDQVKIEMNYKLVRTELAHMFKDPPEMSFNDFLTKINLSRNEYCNVIRHSISKPTMILKREVNAIKVNAYNRNILQLFQANMDIQMILDV